MALNIREGDTCKMTTFINASCSIGYYLIIIFVSFTMARKDYLRIKSQSGFSLSSGESIFFAENVKNKTGIGTILVISLLFFSLNVLVTKLSITVGGDRQNYMLNFYGVRPSPSAGLTFIISIVHQFTSNVEWLWYAATLIVMPITLFAYRISQEATPKALLFFLTTQYVFTTYVNMKQCYANGLISLCFVLSLRNRGMRDKIFCVILILLAYLFHPTALMAFPVCFIMWQKKNRTSVFMFFIAFAVFLALLRPLLPHIGSLLSSVAPWLSSKIDSYVVEMQNDTKSAEASLLTAIKGLSWYVITALACVKRSNLKGKIRNYDNYLILSGTLSLIFMASFYNGWIGRLAYYMYLPITVFYCQIMRFVRGWENDCFSISW